VCAVDLTSFNIVAKKGFNNFCLQHQIINPNEKLPHRTTIDRTALNDVYVIHTNKFVELLKTTPETLAITFDGWTDNYKHMSYIT